MSWTFRTGFGFSWDERDQYGSEAPRTTWMPTEARTAIPVG